MEKTYAIRSAVLAVLLNAGFVTAVDYEMRPRTERLFQRAAELHVDCTTDEECQLLCEQAQDDNGDCEDILKSE